MPLRADLLNPIKGDNPSGPNLRYDPLLDKIKEARREDLDVAQGEWKTTVKTADHKLVIKLASELVATRSKDLQVAVWLVEAHVRLEGFKLIAPSFRFIQSLMTEFWDTLHPEIEDDDLELRAAALSWLGSQERRKGDVSGLALYLKLLPLTADKLSWYDREESRKVPTEVDAQNSEEKERVRNLLVGEGKLTPEKFDASVNSTPLDFFDAIALELEESLAALKDLSDFCDEKFGTKEDWTPTFRVSREALEDLASTVLSIIKGKGGDRPAPQHQDEEEEEEHVEEEPTPTPTPSRSSRASFQDDFKMSLSAEEVTAEEPHPTEESSEEEQPEEEVEEVVETTTRRRKSSGSGTIEPSDPEDAAARLAAICRYFRKENEVDVAPYLIMRGFRWGELRYAAPPIRPDLLEPPPTEVRVKLKQLLKAQDWNELIPACEEAMALPCGRGWLDLQRYAVLALDGRGFNEVVMAIKSTLLGLITDLPEILDLELTDGTPAASPETKEWIETSVRPQPPKEKTPEEEASSDSSSDDFSFGDSSSDETPSEETPSDDSSSLDFTASEPTPAEEPLPEPPPAIDLAEMPPILDEIPMETPETVDEGPKDIFDQAIGEVRAGNTKGGIQLITRTLATERCGRMRFKRRTQIAHLLVASGQEHIAKPILNDLAAEIDARKLDDWEDNEAIAYSIELLLRCLVKDAGESERRAELYTKMCRLDPVRAMNHSYTNG
jgi:type VI secretion system protein ImpA